MDVAPSATPQVIANLEKVETAKLNDAKYSWYEYWRSRLPTPFFSSRKTTASHPLSSHESLPRYNPLLERKEETFLYLAYGSNLASKTFRGARKVQPLSATNVVVPALRLVFDLPGFPFSEPCFANTRFRSSPSPQQLIAMNDDTVSEKSALLAAPASMESGQSAPHLGWDKGLVGVVYEVTKTDYARIIATEGGGASYADIEIECFPLPADTIEVPQNPTGESFKAHTLFASDAVRMGLGKRREGWAQPSARYLGLLTTGADEHQIPKEYRDWLQSLRAFHTTTVRQNVGKIIFAANWLPLLFFLFSLQRLTADDNGKVPAWFRVILDRLFKSIWTSYDYFYKRVFGEGERTIGDKFAGDILLF